MAFPRLAGKIEVQSDRPEARPWTHYRKSGAGLHSSGFIAQRQFEGL